jgi:hypothetical protein
MGEAIDAGALARVWKQRVEAWRESGRSQKAFCQVHDLPYNRFVYWRRKFDDGAGRREPAGSDGGFAAVVRESALDTALSLSLPNGLVVRGICAANVLVVRQLLDQFR